MKRFLKITVLMLFLLVAGVLLFGYFYVRNRGFSSREEPSWMETFLARNARKLATPAAAKGLPNPETMTPEKWAEAREHFVEHCSVCHGTDGRGDTTFGKNMYPKVPNLAGAQTQGLSDGEMFYIISNGVRLTGMPAFGGEDSPESIWHLVSFIRRLPNLSAEEIKQLNELASGVTEPTSPAPNDIGTGKKSVLDTVPKASAHGGKPHKHSH